MTESFDMRRMLNGELYRYSDEQHGALVEKGQMLIREFNASTDEERKDQILWDLLGSRGEACNLVAPIGFDYGWNTFIGENFFANMDLIILDVCEVRIGDNCFFGPRVSLLTATHPTAPGPRAANLESGVPITIGDNVWLGGGVIVNPGVTIGDNTVIGSGSVVTRDIPAGVIAAGNPCRIIREITDEEIQMWEDRAAEHDAAAQAAQED